MDVLTHNISNMTIDSFLKQRSNYLFESDAGYVALLVDKDVRPFSMFRPFYIKPDEIRDCWLIKDVFRKWAGKLTLISIVPVHRVNTFTRQMKSLGQQNRSTALRAAS